jgi:hypothetical protein
MTPKDKAKEMYIKFDFVYVQNYTSKFEVKRCALIAVDEIIKECYNWNGSDNVQWETNRFDYWNEVKQEIEKL